MQVPGAPMPDLGAHAMQNAAAMNEIGTIATAQLVGGLSGMIVSEGLTKLIREMLGAEASSGKSAQGGAQAGAEDGKQEQPSEGEQLAESSAKAFKEMVLQGAVGRIVALQAVNTYLSLATSDQLRKWGAELLGTQVPPAGGERAGPTPVQPGAAPVPQAAEPPAAALFPPPGGYQNQLPPWAMPPAYPWPAYPYRRSPYL